MEKLRIKLVHDRRKTGANPAPIEFYCYFGNGEKLYLPTGYTLNQNYWRNGEIEPAYPQKAKLMALLKRKIAEIEAEEYNYLMSGKKFTPQALKSFVNGGTSVEMFAPWARKLIQDDQSLQASSKRPTLRLIQLIDETYPDTRFSDLNYIFVKNFDNHLREAGYKPNTVKRYHKDLKKLIRLAIVHDQIKGEQNPYLKFKLGGWQNKTEFLYRHEVDALRNLDLTSSIELQTIRDMFVFACFTGLRHSDLHRLKKTDFENREQGLVINLKTTEKTDTPVFLRLYEMFQGEPENIIRPYIIAQTQHQYVWGRVVTNQAMNAALKILAKLAGINKLLTVHLARHTFGTWYAKECGNVFELCRAMGLRSFKTGQIYVNLAGML